MRTKFISLLLVCLTQTVLATESTTLAEFNDYENNEERLFGIVTKFENSLWSERGWTRLM